MAVIEDGANTLGIDANGAAAMTLYDSDGIELNPPWTGIYSLPIDMRCGAVTAGAAVYLWAMRVDAGADKDIYIFEIELYGGFDGTAAASTVIYRLQRFDTAAPTGGTALTPIKHDAAYPTSDVTDARFNAAGLTAGSVALVDANHFAVMTQAHQNGSNGRLNAKFYQPNNPYAPLKLTAGQGILIQLNPNNTVAGDSLSGRVTWGER